MTERHIMWDMIEGRIPYSADMLWLNGKIVDAVPGSGRIAIDFDGNDFPTHMFGNVGGGAISAMLDLVSGFAPATTYRAGEYGPTLELKVSYIRAAKPGMFHGIGTLIHRSNRIAFAEAQLRDANQSLIATASTTIRIIRLE